MTIVPLTGGIGNQMFQYACGRAVAHTRKDDLVLVTDFLFSPEACRKYSLDAFDIRAQVRQDWEFSKNVDVLWGVHQVDSRFSSTVFQSSWPNVVLRGYWESEKYFSEIAQAIRLEFKFKEDFLVKERELRERLTSTESVCLHVRRTDVLSEVDPKGFVGIEYYQAALRTLAERISGPIFIYVFSDDIEWCASNLRLVYPHTFLSPRDNREDAALRDLSLMTECKHFIIANSTFSWWGAWLGSHPAKLVIAPRRWYRREGFWSPQLLHNFNSHDLIPKTWLRV